MNKNEPSIEQMFAVGRSARSNTHKTCSRCKGTGWWQLGRVCFKCGGVGRAERVTLATQLRDKRAHVAEVEGLIAQGEAQFESLRFGKRSALERIEADRANLAKLRLELAALEAQS